MKKNFILLIFMLFFYFSNFTFAQTNSLNKKNESSYVVNTIVNNLGIVWGMSFISKDSMIFTQKSGEIGILNTKTKKIKYIYNVSKVRDIGQGGLLDVAIAPDFDINKFIYFTYVKNVNGQGITVLSRAKFINKELIDWEDLLLTKSSTNANRHFGSRIAFDGNGHVFFSVGDRGIRSNAQNLANHSGSILRINLDGSVPIDNPFVNNKKALKEIYSYGHRNPQGLFYDKKNKRLWSIEHGPRGGDEINLILSGKNYGWPVISYGKEYWSMSPVGIGTHKEGMQQPHKVYIPSIAPSSLIVYSGKTFKEWEGNLLSGALKLQHLNRIVVDDEGKILKEDRLLENLKERIRCVTEDINGIIFISTDSGKIIKISSNNK